MSLALGIAILDGMDPLSVTVYTIALFAATSRIYRATRLLASQQQHELLARNYGAFYASVVAWLSPETARQYESIDYYILRGSKEEAMSFRQAITNECNMTAVAVSLFPQAAKNPLMYVKNASDKGRRELLSLKSQSLDSVYHSLVIRIG